jgi:hypothetical protein
MREITIAFVVVAAAGCGAGGSDAHTELPAPNKSKEKADKPVLPAGGGGKTAVKPTGTLKPDSFPEGSLKEVPTPSTEPAPETDAKWTAVGGAGFGFDAVLPGKPQPLESSLESNRGKASLKGFVCEHLDSVFMALGVNAPNGIRSAEEAKRELDDFIKGFAQTSGIRLNVIKSGVENSVFWMDLAGQSGDQQARAFVCATRKGVYCAVVVGNPATVNSSDADKFLSEFQPN